MKHTLIDPSQLELEERVVSIKRVTKVVKGGRNMRCGASVLLKTSPEGTGIIAGGPSRIVLELAGYKNIRSKSLGSNNKQNVVLATIEGLKNLKTPEQVAKLRGKSVEELLG